MNITSLVNVTATLLIVDESSTLSEKIKSFLCDYPSIRIVNNDGSDHDTIYAVKMLDPDIVIMNTEIQNANALHLMRDIEQQSHTKVLMVCDAVEEDRIKDIMSAGASGIIITSSMQNDLPAAIQRIKNGELFFSPSITKSIVALYLRQTAEKESEHPV